MSDSVVKFDASGNPVLVPLRNARAPRPKRPAPTPAELGLTVTASDPEPETPPAGASAEDRAAIEQTEAMIRERRRAYFANAASDDDGRDPLAPEVRASGGGILFSADQGSTAKRSGDGITVNAAAEAAGLSEQAFTEAIVGKARLQMVNGEMVASVADLRELAEAGTIPRPSDVRKVKAATAEVEGKGGGTADPAVEARIANAASMIGMEAETVRAKRAEPSSADQRTDAMADRLGVDLGERKPTAETETPAPAPVQSAGIVVKAKPREPRPGMGRPQRLRPTRLANNG